MPSLESIHVDASNEKYSSENGVLFDKPKETLIQYPAGKDDPSYAIPGSVTSIGDYAFEECGSLESMTLPDSVISVGYAAFFRCTALESVTFGRSVTSIGDYAFPECTSLVSVTIGGSVTSIGDYAFYWCTALESVTIGGSVTYIGDYAFEDCTSLEYISVDASNGMYSSEDGVLFDKPKETLIQYPAGKDDPSYTVPGSVESVSDKAFYHCTSLKDVTIGDSVSYIGEGAFYKCTSLESITVGVSNTKYSSEDGVLFDRDKKELIQYPSGKKDPAYTVPGSVESVRGYAFFECTFLESIDVDASNGTYSSENGVLFDHDKKELIRYPAGKKDPAYTVPGSVESIGDFAFEDCVFLGSVTIPGSVTHIGGYAFSWCTSLESIEVEEGNTAYSSENGVLFDKPKTVLIQYPVGKSDQSYAVPDSVAVIGSQAFSGCTSLESVTIPGGNGVFVQNNAFVDCTSLETIRITGGTAAFFQDSSITFMDGAEHTIYVAAPEGFFLPDYSLYGDVKIVYGEKPSGFPTVPAAVGIIVMLMLVGEAFAVRRGRN